MKRVLCWLAGHPPCIVHRMDRDDYRCPCGVHVATRMAVVLYPYTWWLRLCRRVAL